MHYCWLRLHRQIFPANQLDRLGVLFVDVLYGCSTILEVPVDAPGRIPRNHLQLPEFLPQIYLAPVRKGQLDRLQDRVESALSLSWLYARLLDYRGDYGFLCRVRHRDRVRFGGSKLTSVSPLLNRHSTDQLKPAFLRTMIVYRLNVSPVTPWAVSLACCSELVIA
jgi:hypothetical protein